jgi:hypothetical protein
MRGIWNDRRLRLWLFGVTSVVFLLSPARQIEDSFYSILTSESLLHRQSFDLRSYHIPRMVPSAVSVDLDLLDPHPFYQLTRVNGAIVYGYPLGSSILSLPMVALLNLFGLSVSSHGPFDPETEAVMQRLIAAFLMATLTCIFFNAARLLLPVGLSVAIALGAAFGTPVWSSLSRGLWGQTWAVFLAGYLMYRLLEDDSGGRPLNGITAATLASWIFLTRPTGAIVVVGVTIYIALYRRGSLLQFLVTGAFWLTCFIGLSLEVYGRTLPQYYQGGFLRIGQLPEGLAGILLSPSRGLFIFVPVSLWVLYLVVRNYPTLPHRALVWLALAISLVYVPIIACDAKWWGGWSYGPRLMSDLIPWLVLLAILACKAQFLGRGSVAGEVDPRASAGPGKLAAIGVAALVISILMNAPGALSAMSRQWNITGGGIDYHPERLWDWKRPQFLAWAFLEPQASIHQPPALSKPNLQAPVSIRTNARD